LEGERRLREGRDPDEAGQDDGAEKFMWVALPGGEKLFFRTNADGDKYGGVWRNIAALRLDMDGPAPIRRM
jgi:hypothetical protein